jgi:hypothetical protein
MQRTLSTAAALVADMLASIDMWVPAVAVLSPGVM